MEFSKHISSNGGNILSVYVITACQSASSQARGSTVIMHDSVLPGGSALAASRLTMPG